MNLNEIKHGKNLPNEFNVIIEIPMNSDPVKYEIDKKNGLLIVDRFINTSMHYPVNYGHIPKTLSLDKDCLDAMVICPFPLHIGSIINCRTLGMLNMIDDSGIDNKILSVPVDNICYNYLDIIEYTDLVNYEIIKIEHFFKHYKDAEKYKWTKIEGWSDSKSAKQEIINSVERYKKSF